MQHTGAQGAPPRAAARPCYRAPPGGGGCPRAAAAPCRTMWEQGPRPHMTRHGRRRPSRAAAGTSQRPRLAGLEVLLQDGQALGLLAVVGDHGAGALDDLRAARRARRLASSACAARSTAPRAARSHGYTAAAAAAAAAARSGSARRPPAGAGLRPPRAAARRRARAPCGPRPPSRSCTGPPTGPASAARARR